MLVIAEMVSVVSKMFSQLLACTENVECTDCTAGYGRKMFH
jgi:hypothetical protein